MNESSRNTRTLIVSFVIAIMALIPLRFVEVGQMMGEQPQVLGEEVVLPDDGGRDVLEAPYNEIENGVDVLGEEVETACIASEESANIIAAYQNQIDSEELDGEQINAIVEEMKAIENETCK